MRLPVFFVSIADPTRSRVRPEDGGAREEAAAIG
jgi:hypothetical protein